MGGILNSSRYATHNGKASAVELDRGDNCHTEKKLQTSHRRWAGCGWETMCTVAVRAMHGPDQIACSAVAVGAHLAGLVALHDHVTVLAQLTSLDRVLNSGSCGTGHELHHVLIVSTIITHLKDCEEGGQPRCPQRLGARLPFNPRTARTSTQTDASWHMGKLSRFDPCDRSRAERQWSTTAVLLNLVIN